MIEVNTNRKANPSFQGATSNYDLIGDIHGHLDALLALLKRLGYREKQGCWRHSERTAVFVGDFIDRGPRQLATLTVIRRMIDGGSALAIMGNHEFNAISWLTPDPVNPGEYLRPHISPKWGEKNRHQHAAFLAEVENKPQLHRELIEWFQTLPLWLELPGIRVVHACWHAGFMAHLAPKLAPGHRMTEALLHSATQEPEADSDTSKLTDFNAVEALLKGLEIPLPTGHRFTDKDGISRERVRIRWWDQHAKTYRTAAMLDEASRQSLPETEIPEPNRLGYSSSKPLFFGHYWLTGQPRLLSENVACVDYSAGKGEPLCAYRWDGEPVLQANNFVLSRDVT